MIKYITTKEYTINPQEEVILEFSTKYEDGGTEYSDTHGGD